MKDKNFIVVGILVLLVAVGSFYYGYTKGKQEISVTENKPVDSFVEEQINTVTISIDSMNAILKLTEAPVKWRTKYQGVNVDSIFAEAKKQANRILDEKLNELECQLVAEQITNKEYQEKIRELQATDYAYVAEKDSTLSIMNNKVKLNIRYLSPMPLHELGFFSLNLQYDEKSFYKHIVEIKEPKLTFGINVSSGVDVVNKKYAPVTVGFGLQYNLLSVY